MRSTIFICLFIIQLGYSLNIHSQEEIVIPHSPEVAGLGKYLDFPVSNYTGIASVSIPIWNIELKNFSLPISLDYHAKGIQVEEEASNVGLGWNLLAGGCITRSVRGEPDDYNKSLKYVHKDFLKSGKEWDRDIKWPSNSDTHYRIGLFWHGKWDKMKQFNELSTDYLYVSKSLLDINTIEDRAAKVNLEELNDGLNDLEPDIFYFNFGGYSGKFVFDISNGKIGTKLLSYQNIFIEGVCKSGELTNFIIRDDKGNTYYFEAPFRVKTTSYSTHKVSPTSTLYTPVGETRTITNNGWYLVQITTVLGDVIDFHYENDNYLSYSAPTLIKHSAIETGSNNGESFYKGIVMTESLSYPRLSRIETPHETIKFYKGTSKRLDTYATSYPISKIEVIQKYKNTILKSFNLKHSYFKTQNMSKTQLDKIREQSGNTISQEYLNSYHVFYRLKLDEIKEGSKPSYVFSYNAGDELPSRLSYAQDAWGFYNGANNNETLIPTLYHYNKDLGYANKYTFLEFPYSKTYIFPDGGNRQANPSVITKGMLTKIVYPTGGYTEFEYESNQFINAGTTFYGGGVRVKSIKKFAEASSAPSLEKHFNYMDDSGKTSGKIISIPSFVDNGIYRNLPAKYNKIKNSSYNLLNTTQGGFVGYTQVSVFESTPQNMKQKIVYSYSCPGAFGDENDSSGDNIYKIPLSKRLRSGIGTMPAMDKTVDPFGAPFPPNPSYDWARGLLLSEKYYKYGSDKPLKQINYAYKPVSYADSNKIYGIKFNFEKDSYSLSPQFSYEMRTILFCKYHDLTNTTKVLSSKIEYTYEDNSTTPIVKETYYSYANRHLNISEEKTTGASQNEFYIKRYKYNFDFPIGGSNMNGMYLMAYFCYNKLLEMSEFVNKNGVDYLINSTYWSHSKSVLPDGVFTINTNTPITNFKPLQINSTTNNPTVDSRYEQKIKFLKYVNGNCASYQKEDQPIVTVLWAYNNKYPVMKIVNATYDHAISVLKDFGTTPENWEGSYYPLKDLVESILREGFKDALVTTYNFRPLVGMECITDPSGLTTYYEYDDSDRLKEVYIMNGTAKEVLESYKYNYVNQ